MVDLLINRNCLYQTVDTAGTLSAAIIQRYIERAEQVAKRR
jgi:hypothetical protein